MKYTVIAQAAAVADAEEIRSYLAHRDPDYAARWIDELDGVFSRLAEFPNRFAIAPESTHSTFPVRNVLVGQYRLLYAVHGSSVQILRIRHAARRPLKPGEFN